MAAKMKVLVASAPRSGGTWLFNATRLILGSQGGEVHGAWCNDYNHDHPADYHVVKAHETRQVMFEPSAILTTHREIFERMASLIRMGWLKNTPSAILSGYHDQKRLYDAWKDRSSLEIEYATIVDAPAEAIKAIANVLNMDLSDQQAVDIADQVRNIETPKEGSYDRVTLLHKAHRDGGAETAMTAQQLRDIVANAA